MQDNTLTDLLQKLKDGDPTALEALYYQLSTPLYTVMIRMTGDTHLAEDILQEFFLKLYRQPPASIPQKPRAYLFQMAHNLTIDILRKERPAASLSDCEGLVCTPDTLFAERLDLARALAALSAKDREIVTLHTGVGLTFREVAAVIAMPLGTVLWRYQRAIGKLRELLNGGI